MCTPPLRHGSKRHGSAAKGETDPNTTFLMMNEGRLIFDGSLHDLVHSEDPFVREFLE